MNTNMENVSDRELFSELFDNRYFFTWYLHLLTNMSDGYWYKKVLNCTKSEHKYLLISAKIVFVQYKMNTDYHIFPFVKIFFLTIQVMLTAKIVNICNNKSLHKWHLWHSVDLRTQICSYVAKNVHDASIQIEISTISNRKQNNSVVNAHTRAQLEYYQCAILI